jgi:hypothetical protein
VSGVKERELMLVWLGRPQRGLISNSVLGSPQSVQMVQLLGLPPWPLCGVMRVSRNSQCLRVQVHPAPALTPIWPGVFLHDRSTPLWSLLTPSLLYYMSVERQETVFVVH